MLKKFVISRGVLKKFYSLLIKFQRSFYMSMRDEAWFEYLNEKNIGFNPYNTYELVVEIKREKGVKLPKN